MLKKKKRNTPSIQFAADKFSVSSIIIKHTQNHSVFPRIQLGWPWIGDSAWAPSGSVPLHLNYHVPSLCSDQSVFPPTHPLNHRPLPIHPVSVTEQAYWAPSLSLETGCPASRFQSETMAGNWNGTPFSAWVPTTSDPRTWPSEMEQWSAAKLGKERQWRAGWQGRVEQSDQASKPGFTTGFSWLWQVTLPPQVIVSSYGKWGTTAPTLKTDCEN